MERSRQTRHSHVCIYVCVQGNSPRLMLGNYIFPPATALQALQHAAEGNLSGDV